jgi:hypothetical protein
VTTTLELHDSAIARRHLLQGLALSRAAASDETLLSAALGCALEIAVQGEPLPPLGLLADLHLVAFGALHPVGQSYITTGILDPALARRYEDYVLGKLYADLSFERGADALRRYPLESRARGLAYLAGRLVDRDGCGGTVLGPAVIRALQELPPAEVLREGWGSLEQEGLAPQLATQIERLIDAFRGTGDLLGAADIFELEHGTALAEFGQRVALRQVLTAAAELAQGLPSQRPRSRPRREKAVTRIVVEDAYPVGGFASISNRGSVESLLHSQLVYLEKAERPDLFDVKYVRDELLYYSRDENQFLRRRQAYLLLLSPDLVQARFKDAALPYQRIILALALLLAATRQLTAWLSQEALVFRFVFLNVDRPRHVTGALDDERELLEMLLREELAAGRATLEAWPRAELMPRYEQESRRSLTRCLLVAPQEMERANEVPPMCQLLVSSSEPAWISEDGERFGSDERGLAAWQEMLTITLRHLL